MTPAPAHTQNSAPPRHEAAAAPDQPAGPSVGTRTEHDLLGSREVPQDAYWGVHTLRAVENFPVTGTVVGDYPDLVRALACVKQAAAQANRDLGTLEATKADAIVHACEQLRAGRYADQFVVDMIQGGAGTPTNMNANEVIANLALEHLGHVKGSYQLVHPNEDVNQSQSTNDVYPTALKLATIFAFRRPEVGACPLVLGDNAPAQSPGSNAPRRAGGQATSAQVSALSDGHG
jgi:fumarate hydratase class II